MPTARKWSASSVVLDDGPTGGETGRTTAHLASALDDRFAPDGHVLNGPAVTGLARKD